MIVKVIKHFGDKTTGETYKEQIKREIGDIFECDDELAEERIKNGFVKKASKKEEKEYIDSIDTIDESDISVSSEQEEQPITDDTNNNVELTNENN